MPESPVVRCEAVVKTYELRTGIVRALDGVDLSVVPGSFVALFGPSGSGKSTLLRLLAGTDRPDFGSIVVAGHELTRLGAIARRRVRRRSIGVVLQDPGHNLVPYLDALGQLRLSGALAGAPIDAAAHRALLSDLGLGHRLDHFPAQMSGGEQQRLAVAAALAGRPAVTLMDEPTGELDRASAGTLLDMLAAQRDTGATFVVSSHDRSVADTADVVVELRHGRLAVAS